MLFFFFLLYVCFFVFFQKYSSQQQIHTSGKLPSGVGQWGEVEVEGTHDSDALNILDYSRQLDMLVIVH